MRKAFDTVNHCILLEKLCAYGFRGKFNKLILSYLTNRQQFVVNSNGTSRQQVISYGVPQGSVLGPLFFLLYINDINKIVSKSELSLFADDTAILASFPTTRVNDYFKNDVLKTDDWCVRNKLSISSTKCKILPFGKQCCDNDFSLAGENIGFTNCFKYSGVIIDSQIKFTDHVKTVCRLGRFNGIMYKGRVSFSRKMLLKFYLAYVVPIISYGLLVYGSTSKTNLEKIYICQKRILRTIFFKRKYDHITTKFNDLGIDTVHEIYLTQLFKETIFQYLKRSPLDFLNVSNYSNKRNTRSTSNGMIPFYRYRTETMENSLSFKIVKCFNFLMSNKLLPDKIETYSQEQLSKFLKVFKKNYILDNVQLVDNFF